MHRIVLSLLMTCLLISSCSSQITDQQKFPRFIPKKKDLFKIKKDQNYTFGYLEVLEDRSNPKGSTIKLPVYIFKSRSDKPKKDPILYTVGGPGATTMPSAQYARYYTYLDDRDLIYFEQRGTQYAQPSLDCPEWANAQYQVQDPKYNDDQRNELLEEAAKACYSKLRSKGIDLNNYHTNAIAADIEDLRKVLGIDQWNLLTISYSTKIAQVLMRDYPEGIRSVVMDSPLPLEVSWDEESNQNLVASYQKIFQDCADDPACKQAFPDLEKRFWAFLEKISKEPLTISIQHPKDKTILNFKLRGKDVAPLVVSVGSDAVVDIPFEINRLLEGDYSLLEASLGSDLESPSQGIGMGMRLSVWCAEESPFVDWNRVNQESTKYPAISGLSPTVFEENICQIWSVKKVAEIENQAISSDIPTLLISGGYDPITPERWAKNMLRNLEQGFQLSFKGWMHGPTTFWSNPCAMSSANAFFNDPSQRPELDCWKAIKRPSFRIE